MKKNILTCLSLAGMLYASTSIAGPFGLSMGMKLEDVGIAPEKTISNGKYKFISVPNPHSSFDGYILKFSPTKGLCWIKAIGKDVDTSVYGYELRSAFNDMKGKLEKAYGPTITTDKLLYGSIWKEPNEFMMSLIKSERLLFSIWDKKAKSKLSDNIDSIGLFVGALSRNKGYSSVEYSFSNEAECDKELTEKEDSAL
ncbi:hypothetical protein [Azomonas macrocytogenes]|uniref:Uncharacterized protein n=1 Tax=Azomonas macrocytogenes TaxID=69962 RepID=A0A839T2V1_AZOMA|nr:hypothetical protein [Azomonas macrocytogenes]MBB3103742.1 hypothetical protein [Azomonas macrocytogenes]